MSGRYSKFPESIVKPTCCGGTRLLCVQVRKDCARQRKLLSIAAARDGSYARYVNIYKDLAAEKYARVMDASRWDKGGIDSYRRRIVASSMDAERYRGCSYYEAMSQLPDDTTGNGRPTESSNPSIVGSQYIILPVLVNDRKAQAKRNAPEQPSTIAESAKDPGTLSAAKLPELTGNEEAKRVATEAGPSDALVDVVPFNNIRAKYLRTWSDTALSRPYHVSPSPGSRGNGGVLKPVTTRIGSVGSQRTLEACRKAREQARRPSKTFTEDGKNWCGA